MYPSLLTETHDAAVWSVRAMETRAESECEHSKSRCFWTVISTIRAAPTPRDLELDCEEALHRIDAQM